MCAHCEKPFDGRRHYEKKGLAYCEAHFNMVSLNDRLYIKRTVGVSVLNVCVCLVVWGTVLLL